jgi:hypothetical protein
LAVHLLVSILDCRISGHYFHFGLDDLREQMDSIP